METNAKRMVFKEHLIKKILAGVKTQTRRLIKKTEKDIKYRIGDVLWVPESFCMTEDGVIHYRLDELDAKLHWQASLFMPMRYARVWLEVVDSCEQTVREITEEDAAKEGFDSRWERGQFLSPRDQFARVFDECYGEGAWDRNPLVWVVGFRRIKPPVEMLVKRNK